MLNIPAYAKQNPWNNPKFLQFMISLFGENSFIPCSVKYTNNSEPKYWFINQNQNDLKKPSLLQNCNEFENPFWITYWISLVLDPMIFFLMMMKETMDH